MQKQYQKMINDALDPEYSPPTKVSDLVGFWEMIAIQVDNSWKVFYVTALSVLGLKHDSGV